METTEVKDFYNASLKASPNPYEQDRWFRHAQAEAGYHNTKAALLRVVPRYLKNDMHVFELGPGPGTWTKELLTVAPRARYDLVDISEEMLKQAQTNLEGQGQINYTCSDILAFEPQTSYDFFFSSRILEYVPDKVRAMQVISGALKSGAHGYLVTKTPQYRRAFGKKIAAPVHQTQISPGELEEILKQSGLTVVDRVHVTCVFPALRSGVLDRLLTSICRLLPFSWCTSVSESYALVFKKQ